MHDGKMDGYINGRREGREGQKGGKEGSRQKGRTHPCMHVWTNKNILSVYLYVNHKVWKSSWIHVGEMVEHFEIQSHSGSIRFENHTLKTWIHSTCKRSGDSMWEKLSEQWLRTKRAGVETCLVYTTLAGRTGWGHVIQRETWESGQHCAKD